MSKLPLSRFTVIDLTRARSGPTAVRQLADWGADVLKIESPGDESDIGSRHGSDFQNLHRNKRSLTLNLKDPEGVAIFKRLAERADVLVENYRPAVKHRLGIDYETLCAINPRLIYASISGFGQDGPYRDRPGFDQIAQGMGGLMSITGLPGQGPVRAGVAVADLTAGVFCAMGILIALLEREESGQGQWVQSSLLAAQIAMLDFQAARWLISGEVPEQAGNNHPTSIPTGVFATADGHINIAASGGEIFARLCRALGADALATDPAFATGRVRLRNRDQLNQAIETITRTRSSAEWIERLNRAGVPSGPINRIDQVFADPQVRQMGITRTIESSASDRSAAESPRSHPAGAENPALRTAPRFRQELVGQAVELSRTPWVLRMPTPAKGEHSDAVLSAIGYDASTIASLRTRRII
jgi:crotonobetainyl-CoA:carnitine CoA-transferase CaiB-like acyl-CoA transferase